MLHNKTQKVTFWSLPDLLQKGEVNVGEEPTDMIVLKDGRLLVTNCAEGSLSLIQFVRAPYHHSFIPIGGAPLRIIPQDGGNRYLILHDREASLSIWELP